MKTHLAISFLKRHFIYIKKPNEEGPRPRPITAKEKTNESNPIIYSSVARSTEIDPNRRNPCYDAAAAAACVPETFDSRRRRSRSRSRRCHSRCPERKLRRMNAAFYMVFTKNHRDYDNHFKTLAAVLGSEKATKKAFVDSHGPLTTAFSAILTPENVDQISKHPDIFDVVESTKIVFHH